MSNTSFCILRTKTNYSINLTLEEGHRVELLYRAGEKFLCFQDMFGASLCIPAENVDFLDTSTEETRQRNREHDRMMLDEIPFDERD